jgi:hypothetical protein
VLIIGRCCLVGLSGPLIIVRDSTGYCVMAIEHWDVNCYQ